jgi:hypothetical protein
MISVCRAIVYQWMSVGLSAVQQQHHRPILRTFVHVVHPQVLPAVVVGLVLEIFERVEVLVRCSDEVGHPVPLSLSARAVDT